MNNIPEVPDIPDSLKEAAAYKKLVPFIGAGVSKLVGYPGWDEFANEALRFFVSKGILDHSKFDQIRMLPSRMKLSLAAILEQKHSLEIDYKKILCRKDINQNNDNIYKHILALLQFSRTFVTTNFDTELDGKAPTAPTQPRINNEHEKLNDSLKATTTIYNRNEIGVRNLNIENAVIHIHGSVCDPNSMVLTTSDYLRQYYGHEIDGPDTVENPFLSFLQELFKTRNVLFIGYGLEELELLEYVLQKGIANRPNSGEEKTEKHYVIQGFYSHNLEQATSMESYFQSLGITLLPFSRDKRDWHGLTCVVKYLIDKLPPGERLELDDKLMMDELLPKE